MENTENKYYVSQGEFTALGTYAAEISSLPGDAYLLSQIVQGNLLHDGFYKNYGLTHVSGLYHYMEDLLDAIKKKCPYPLTVPKTPEMQVQVCCRDFSVLLVSFLREKGIPARARCGFCNFNPQGTMWYDHWISEYWNEPSKRWVKVDAQLNPHVRETWKLTYDPFDVPDSVFQTAGVAWTEWRNGNADPSKYSIDNQSGSWLIRGNLLRDFAALNKIEIEPHMMRINMGYNWNSWRLLAAHDNDLTENDYVLLDRVAKLSSDADQNFEEIRSLYESNHDLQPPKDIYPRM